MKKTAADIAAMMRENDVSPEVMRHYLKVNAGTRRGVYTCPRCSRSIEVEVNLWDGSTVCPVCENDIILSV